jgi:hypothetical protein
MLTDMTCERATGSATAGWLVFVAAIGMMLGLLSVDLTHLKGWNEATTPAFVGTALGRLAAVIGAFVAGKLIPAGPDDSRLSTSARGVRRTK